jgi:hypothetical protein
MARYGGGAQARRPQGTTDMPIRVDTNQPSTRILVLSLIVVIVAIVGHLTRIQYVTQYQFWIAVLGYALLFAGTLYKI